MTSRRETPEQIAENELRVTPIGLFNTALAYWRAAMALEELNLDTPRKHAPIRFLYFHAMELYLKSFLRARGYSVAQLSGLGHDLQKIAERTAKGGLNLDEPEKQVIAMVASSNMVIRSRYIRTGAVRGWLSTKILSHTCMKFHSAVGNSLKKQGLPVRL